ncbi:MAG: hypothetical protein AB8B87_19180 [Granulosicoccus sp.]
MSHTVRGLLVIASALFSTSALSQDLFSSTNSTVHSYNYLEVQYLTDMDASPPVLAALLLDISDNWSFKAEYLNQEYDDLASEFDFVDNSVVVTASAQVLSAGGLYHHPFSRMAQSDWIAGFMLGRTEVSVEIPSINFSGEADQSFQEFYAGIRRTFTPKLEGEATINLYRDSDTTDTTYDVKVVYRAFEAFDVAVAGNELGGADIIGIGLRYTW